jgi:hypothetical protein
MSGATQLGSAGFSLKGQERTERRSGTGERPEENDPFKTFSISTIVADMINDARLCRARF